MITSEYWFLIVLALVWIVVAIVQDFRKREVANWLNFSLVAIALSYRAFLSLTFWNYSYMLQGIIGFAIFFCLANLFYYGRIFAGGDAKLLMALGSVLPFSSAFSENLNIFIYFIVLLLIGGSFYGLIYSFAVSFRNRKKFAKEFVKQIKSTKKLFKIFIVAAIIFLFIVLIIKEYILSLISLIILSFPFLYSYAKAIEESSMIKSVRAKDLTIGDWLYEPVKISKRTIKPNWEGLSESELKVLRKYKGKILVKDGIPFTPSFLIAFIILLWLRYSSWSFF